MQLDQRTAREPRRLPLRGLAFERRQWRMQRERQAAAVRKCESEQPKHERRTARGQSWRAKKDLEARLRER